ncbi:MAG: TolC family protein [Muribaculaceae bacterium]|nr:TolC family protein [Muribaculaceae bacterium]
MKQVKLQLVVVSALLVPALTGCNLYKKFEMPADTPLQQEYVDARAAQLDPDELGNLPWERVFTDPMLVDLINQALDANTNLDNARINVEIAHAGLRGARLAYLPSLAIAAQGGASSYANGSLGNWNYTIPLTASWEIDAFGKLLNAKRNAEATQAQAEAYAQAVRSQIIGGVANCYYAISTLQRQLDLNRATAEIWRDNVEVMRRYKEAGRTNEAAVMQADANYRSILASITDLETSLHEANNTMSLLLNVKPQTWAVNASALTLPAELGGGIPMAQLAARPDVRAAEAALAIAYYATNQARAAFYPGLTITANYGFTNLAGSIVRNPGEWFANLAGSLVAPLFSRGQNIARLEAAKLQQKQAMNNFEYSLLSASAEVSGALTAYDRANAKAASLAVQVDDLVKASKYTAELFKTADATYLEVLTAQSSLLGAQMSQISCELARAQAIINLYQSLGGGR